MTYPVRAFLLQPPQFGPWAPQRHSRPGRPTRPPARSLEDDLSTVRNELTELDDDVGGDIRATEQAFKRLTGRVQALEAHLLAAGGAPLVGLDTIATEWKKLARTASHGWNVRSGLLPELRREALRLNIRHFVQALEERDEHREKVVEAAGSLATRPRTSREYKQAVMDFGMSRPFAETGRLTGALLSRYPEAARPPQRRSIARAHCGLSAS